MAKPNVRRLEARPVTPGSEADNIMPVTVQALVKNALRMRPDRIIVGEIRDGTIVDMMSAMSTGHEGSMSTVHANSPENPDYHSALGFLCFLPRCCFFAGSFKKGRPQGG